MENKPLISFCIPTFQRLEILKKTIDSIYLDLDGIDFASFEVIVSDNDPKRGAEVLAKIYNEFPNFHYYHTNCEGFLNSYHALRYGTGHFLKLHNNYTCLKSGVLRYLLNQIRHNKESKPVIFFTDGLRQKGTLKRYDCFDSFIKDLSYFSSWSTGFSIWQEDFNRISNSVFLSHYFPQTSLLLEQHGKSQFIINDIPLFMNQSIKNKGGYNIFKVFSVDFLDLLKVAVLQQKISNKTFNRIKHDLFFYYLPIRYFKTIILKIENFEKGDIKNSIKLNYSTYHYYLLIFVSLLSPLMILVRKVRSQFISKLK